MTAEEFYKSKGFYSSETEYSKQFFGEILEIAEAYAKHENKTLQKQVEELEIAGIKIILEKNTELMLMEKQVEVLKGLLVN